MTTKCSLVTACLVLAAMVSHAWGDNWPQWRGPHGNGVSSEKDLPIFWDERRSILWKCELPEWGASTPAIWGDAIFVTSHTSDNRLLLLRIEKATGKMVWSREVGQGELIQSAQPKRSQQIFHRWHNMASPSPVTDGKNVVVHFGNGDLATYDLEGNLLWKRNFQKDYSKYTIWWGHANSPVLVDGLVISVVMQDSLEDLNQEPVASYLVAHDVRDGYEKWKTIRSAQAKAEQFDAYTTPLVATIEGRKQIVVMGANQLDAYDPQTGKQIWMLPRQVGGRTVASPTFGQEKVFAVRGLRGPLFAVKPVVPSRKSDPVTLTRRDIAWTHKTGTPDTCSPVLWETWLFTITDDGIARCHDARSGHVKWKNRLRGKYKASPLVADGRIFFLNTEGLCTVVSASAHFDRLTENQIEDETIASMATSDGKIFIRGKKKLYCIGRD